MPKDFQRNIPTQYERLAASRPDKAAVVYLGEVYTYEMLRRAVERFASSLLQQGLGPGDKVVLYLPNSPQWIIAWLGTLRASAVVVPITPIYTPTDLAYIANDSGARAVVCTDRNYGYVTRVLSETRLRTIITTGLVDLLPWWKRAFGWGFDIVPRGKVATQAGTFSFREFLKSGGPPAPEPEAQADDLAEILYTGGTTKHPKGVPLTHRLLLNSAHEQLMVPAPLFDPADNVLTGAAPLFHVLGQTCGLGTILVTGGTLLLTPRVNLDALLDSIQRHRATTLIGVPALYRMILEHDRLDLYDLSSLRYCFSGGDVLPEEIGRRWKERFGKPIYVGYGATETVGGVAMCPTDRESPPFSMGRVLSSKEVLVIDQGTLTPVTTGQPGELLVRSDPMVSEYWNKPEETATSFLELEGRRWYRTGDVVRQDEADNLYFVDRTVDTIKFKGYRVSASEVESVLQEHSAVIAACCVGIPDPAVGERIKAFVVLKKDVRGVTGYDLIRWCRERLSSYKVPAYIEFRDMLPKSKVGKLLRREIRFEERKRLE